MNEKNLEYLTEQVKFTGFGPDLAPQLKENLAQGLAEFRLEQTTQYGKDQLSTSLHFKKSAQNDLYFFNSYSASLIKENQSEPLKQTFYIHKPGSTITRKEAFNLLDGRAVNKDMIISKEGNKYSAWIQLDFKQSAANGNFKFNQFTQAYGFDLENSLEKLPIQELSDSESRAHLIESLLKGNLQSVTLSGGGDQKVFVQANPQFKTVTTFDLSLHRLTLDRPAQTQNMARQQPVQNQDATQLATDNKDQREAAKKNNAQRHL